MVPSGSAVGLNDGSPGLGSTVTACALFVTTTSTHSWFIARLYCGGRRGARFCADNGGLAIKTSADFDVLTTLYCYLDLSPGSDREGLYLLEVSLFNSCFLNKSICDFRCEKVRHSVWSLRCKERIQKCKNAFVLIHTCIWTR